MINLGTMKLFTKWRILNSIVFLMGIVLTCSLARLSWSEKNRRRPINSTKSEGFRQVSARRLVLSSTATTHLSDELRDYAELDLGIALRHAESLEGDSRSALLSFLFAAVREHPEFVAEHLFEVAIGESERVALMVELANHWPDLDSLLGWVEECPKGPHSGDVYGRIFARMVSDSPVGVFNLLDELRGDTREDAARIFFAHWCTVSPLSALDELPRLDNTSDKLFVKKMATYSLSSKMSLLEQESLFEDWLKSTRS